MGFHRRLFVSSFLLAAVVSVRAEAAGVQVFVASNGSDSNNCADPSTPCATYAGAFAQVSPGGEVLVETTGDYGLVPTITGSVRLMAVPGVLAYTPNRIIVNAPGATVVLKGLTIEGMGSGANGVDVISVGTLHVEGCVITGFTSGVPNGGNGIFIGSPGTYFIRDTFVRGNMRAGILVSVSSGVARVFIDRCRIEDNAFGLDTDAGSVTTIRHSVVAGNMFDGLAAEISGELNIESCMSVNNGLGVYSNQTSLVRVSNSVITGNDSGVAADSTATLLSRGNNTVEGNRTNQTFPSTYPPK
jgi:hypothetical protein